MVVADHEATFAAARIDRREGARTSAWGLLSLGGAGLGHGFGLVPLGADGPVCVSFVGLGCSPIALALGVDQGWLRPAGALPGAWSQRNSITSGSAMSLSRWEKDSSRNVWPVGRSLKSLISRGKLPGSYFT